MSVVINSVTITPNVVNTGGSFIVSVEIYVLYPANNVYPSEDLYPTPDTGALKKDTYVLYPDDVIYPSDALFPKY